MIPRPSWHDTDPILKPSSDLIVHACSHSSWHFFEVPTWSDSVFRCQFSLDPFVSTAVEELPTGLCWHCRNIHQTVLCQAQALYLLPRRRCRLLARDLSCRPGMPLIMIFISNRIYPQTRHFGDSCTTSLSSVKGILKPRRIINTSFDVHLVGYVILNSCLMVHCVLGLK